MALLASSIAVVLLLGSSAASAEGRQDYLVRLLRTSDAFRVRAQAALSLGQLGKTERAVAALERATAGQAPGRSRLCHHVASAARVQVLAARDSTSEKRPAEGPFDERLLKRSALSKPWMSANAVPGETRYLVAVGMPGAKAERVSRQMLFDARIFLSEQLLKLEGVELAPDDLAPSDAKSEIMRRELAGFYLESSVVTLEPKGGGVRAVVSVIVLSYPGRDMRGMLRGAATASGRYSADTAEQAIQGAFVGALRRLPTVLEAARVRGSL